MQKRRLKAVIVAIITMIVSLLLLLPLTIQNNLSAKEGYSIAIEKVKKEFPTYTKINNVGVDFYSWEKDKEPWKYSFSLMLSDGVCFYLEVWVSLGNVYQKPQAKIKEAKKVTQIVNFSLDEKWKIDSDEALELAKENETVKRFYDTAGRGDILYWSMSLDRGDRWNHSWEDRVVWHVEIETVGYTLAEGSGTYLEFILDAADGSLLRAESQGYFRPGFYLFTPNIENPWFMCCLTTTILFVVIVAVFWRKGVIRKWIENKRREIEEERRKAYERAVREWEDKKL